MQILRNLLKKIFFRKPSNNYFLIYDIHIYLINAFRRYSDQINFGESLISN